MTSEPIHKHLISGAHARGGGGGGDSHMEQTGMLVQNFEFNP